MSQPSHNNDNPLAHAVRAMMAIDGFEKVLSFIGPDIKVIPLKGIDLLETIYADTLDREVRDIDLLIPDPDNFLNASQRLIDHGYSPEFNFSLDADALKYKNKVSLKSPSPTLPDVDLHLQGVTKKFFASTTGSFNSDMVARASECSTRKGVMRLDVTDKWLFLAQHLAFHMFNGLKWLKDLWLLQRDMTDDQITALAARTHTYGMTRIAAATYYHLQKHFARREPLRIPDMTMEAGIRFMKFIKANDRQFSHRSKYDRFIAGFWELAFIDDPAKRNKAFRTLIFPPTGVMKNIYRSKNTLRAIMFYPLHVPVMAAGSAMFRIHSKC